MMTEKERLLKAINYLKNGLEEITLIEQEYALLDELIEWHQQHKKKTHAKKVKATAAQTEFSKHKPTIGGAS